VTDSQEILIPAKDRDWSREKWWQEDHYRGFMPGLTADQIDAAIARVAEVFNAKWAAREEPHSAWQFLLMRGTLPLESLVSLGSDLLDVTDVIRLPSIINDLRTPSHYESARVELEVGALFRREGYAVEFHPALPNGKKSDLVVNDGESVFIEVKRLSTSDARASAEELSIILIDAVRELFSKKQGLRFQIELTDAIMDLLGSGPDADHGTIHGLISAVTSELKERLEHDEPPFRCEVAGLARVTVGPDLQTTSLSGPPINPAADLRRILTKFLRNPGEQLHPDHPGILVCKTGAVAIMNAALTRVRVEPFLGANPSARHLSAVVFLPVYSSLPARSPIFPPFVVFNPSAQFPASELSAYQTLARHFELWEPVTEPSSR
jgi:hypothetical protein